MPNNIKDADSFNISKAYVSWHDDKSFTTASKEMGKALEASTPLMRTSGALSNRFQNIDQNTSVRDSFSPWDYKFFRPGESSPNYLRDILAQCMAAYQKVPVVREMIDLMGQFTSQGIRLMHEDEETQAFYEEWFKQVKGPERSERIANLLYRTGNVIIKRAEAKLNPVSIREWKQAIGADVKHTPKPVPNKSVVPYRYTLLNPMIIEVIGEQMAAFTGNIHYVLKLPTTFYNSLSIPLTNFDPSILTQDMPLDIQQAMQNNERYLLLDSDKLVTLFYMKDDWDVWAYPMLYSILDEIILLQKMKMADMTALDGVISHIRVWKLGSLEHKIFPTNAAITKLSNILLNHLAGGAMDLVWGPDLELAQTSTDIANFLGSEKYTFCMNTIHTGLGIPASFGQQQDSMTNNSMSSRILLERLCYGRSVLNSFWEEEIRRVQKAMGFAKPAKIIYDNIVLSDETAEKALWLQMLDRDIVSVAAVQQRFGKVPEIENMLIKREYAARSRGDMPVKTSPYTDSQPDLTLTKIYAQGGMVTPSELPSKYDLHLKEPSPQHQEIKENMFPPPTQPNIANSKPKPKGVAGQGKPKGAKDKKKRDQRTPKMSSKAEEFLRLTQRGQRLQLAISQVVDPYYEEKFGKAIGELSPEESFEVANYKMNVLLNCSPDDDLTPNHIRQNVLTRNMQAYDFTEDYQKLCASFEEKLGRDLTDGDLLTIRSYIFAIVKGGYDE